MDLIDLHIIIKGTVDGEELASTSMEEQELKEVLPEAYTYLQQRWNEIDDGETNEGLIDHDSGDMDWMGACSDGCHVEPDGRCPHGFYSLGIRMGLI